MKKSLFIIAALSAAVLAGCSGNDPENIPQQDVVTSSTAVSSTSPATETSSAEVTETPIETDPPQNTEETTTTTPTEPISAEITTAAETSQQSVELPFIPVD